MSARSISAVLAAQTMSEGVGAIVHRTIGTQALKGLDPFLLLDEFTSQGGTEGGGFPDHPHRGFETVTYMLEGRIEHADNKGHRGVIGPGAIQWMTAGRGIVHSEMPANEAGEPIRGLQLWLNLPADQKMTAPRYQDLEATSVLEKPLRGGGMVRVIAGTYQGVSGGARDIATDPLYLDVSLEADGTIDIELPEHHQAFAYGLLGRAGDGVKTFSKRELSVFTKGTRLSLKAGPTSARFILVAAKSLGEPVARYGPFVMTTDKEIAEAIKDYRAGRF